MRCEARDVYPGERVVISVSVKRGHAYSAAELEAYAEMQMRERELIEGEEGGVLHSGPTEALREPQQLEEAAGEVDTDANLCECQEGWFLIAEGIRAKGHAEATSGAGGKLPVSRLPSLLTSPRRAHH